MVLSEERISHLSHLIVKGMKAIPGVRLLQEEETVVGEIQQIMMNELKLDDQIDRMARERLASYSRRIPEGSSEWNILYKKFIEEELKRRRRL
jgi:hypothetical protein